MVEQTVQTNNPFCQASVPRHTTKLCLDFASLKQLQQQWQFCGSYFVHGMTISKEVRSEDALSLLVDL